MAFKLKIAEGEQVFDLFETSMRMPSCSNELVRHLLRLEKVLLDDCKVSGVTNGYGLKLIYSGYYLEMRKRIPRGGAERKTQYDNEIQRQGGKSYLNTQKTEEASLENRLWEKTCWFKD